MELMIDGLRCDLNPQKSLKLGWSVEALHRAEAQRQGVALTLELPATPTNDRILGNARTPHLAERFNHALHRAEIRVKGALLLEGVVRLLAVAPSAPRNLYRIEIRGGAADWAEVAARQGLDALPIDFSARLMPETIAASWSGEQLVRFLPIAYDDYRAPYAAGSLLAVEQLLTVDDFYPFLHLRSLLEAIFTQAGYTLSSSLLGDGLFESLYISGAYPTSDVTARKRRMDFLARRTADTEATANTLGRVYASPFVAANTVGNLVDAYLPNTPDQEGNLLTDCFSTNGCFTLEQGEILFRPLSEVEVGFEYHLHYRTDYRILTRHRLQGFDSIYLDQGADFHFELSNRFVDRREELTAGQSYCLVIFDYASGESYRLCLSSGEEAARLTVRSGVVTLASTAATESPTLERLNPSTEQWEPYEGDWALYDGYIGERGTTEAEVVIRTAAERVGPTSPKSFRRIYLYGAEPGMTLQLKRGTSLRPCFSPRPAYGEQLTWCDLARHSFRQSELVDAVSHLFDLCIFTDESLRRVYLEPRGTFYGAAPTVDWSDRLLQGGLRIEESDHEQHEARRYGYRTDDGLLQRLNEELDEPFAEWVATSPSKATLMGEQELRNPLFTPTLGQVGAFEGAPSAIVPHVGNRDLAEGIEQFSFSPRILSYVGMRSLPEGERLGAPAPEGSYPLAAFHLPEDGSGGGFTLCFEDRDGAQGLHRFHEEHEAELRAAQRLCATLHLIPDELEGLRHRSTEHTVGLDARFRFRLEGEAIHGRLERIESYDPEREIAQCRFTLLADDRP